MNGDSDPLPQECALTPLPKIEKLFVRNEDQVSPSSASQLHYFWKTRNAQNASLHGAWQSRKNNLNPSAVRVLIEKEYRTLTKIQYVLPKLILVCKTRL